VEPTKEKAKPKEKGSSKAQTNATASKVNSLSRSPSPVGTAAHNDSDAGPKPKGRKFKPPVKETLGADSESEDMDTKRQKFFGKSSSKQPAVEKKDVQSNHAAPKAAGTTSTGDKKKPAPTGSKSEKPSAAASKNKAAKSKVYDEEEENFDLSAVSSASESEDDAVKDDPKPKAVPRKNVDPPQTKKAQGSKPKGADGAKGINVGETSNADKSKPKKRTMNLLGGMTTNGISSTDWWAKVCNKEYIQEVTQLTPTEGQRL
jgi:hypothetical protein